MEVSSWKLSLLPVGKSTGRGRVRIRPRPVPLKSELFKFCQEERCKPLWSRIITFKNQLIVFHFYSQPDSRLRRSSTDRCRHSVREGRGHSPSLRILTCSREFAQIARGAGAFRSLTRTSTGPNSIALHDVHQLPGPGSIAFKGDLLAFVDLELAGDDETPVAVLLLLRDVHLHSR